MAFRRPSWPGSRRAASPSAPSVTLGQRLPGFSRGSPACAPSRPSFSATSAGGRPLAQPVVPRQASASHLTVTGHAVLSASVWCCRLHQVLNSAPPRGGLRARPPGPPSAQPAQAAGPWRSHSGHVKGRVGYVAVLPAAWSPQAMLWFVQAFAAADHSRSLVARRQEEARMRAPPGLQQRHQRGWLAPVCTTMSRSPGLLCGARRGTVF